MGNLVQATTSFAVGIKGTEHIVHQGEVFDDSHEIVRATQGNWVALRVRGEVESATAAPGEKRNASVKTAKADKPDAAHK